MVGLRVEAEEVQDDCGSPAAQESKEMLKDSWTLVKEQKPA